MPFEFALFILASGGGVLGALARQWALMKLCSWLAVIIVVLGLFSAVFMTSDHAIKYRIVCSEDMTGKSCPSFDELPQYGTMTVLFKNTSKYTEAVRNISLDMTGTKTGGQFTEVLSGGEGLHPSPDHSFILGPYQTVAFTFPYGFDTLDHIEHITNRKIKLSYVEDNDCMVMVGCNRNPTLLAGGHK